MSWLERIGKGESAPLVDGLILVEGYSPDKRPADEVIMMEKAAAYGAHAVFFEAAQNGRPAVAQAFVFVSDGHADDTVFAALHKRLWSWGGQLNLWKLYSFRDVPVELISHTYQLFVTDTDNSVYTPPTLVRLMLEFVPEVVRVAPVYQAVPKNERADR